MLPAQAAVARQTREIGTNIHGNGPTTPLEAGANVIRAAQLYAAAGLLFAFVGAAIFFIPAAWGVLSDMK